VEEEEEAVAMEEGHVWQGRRNRYSSPGCQLTREMALWFHRSWGQSDWSFRRWPRSRI